jgi:PAS domain S-box-containing protein
MLEGSSERVGNTSARSMALLTQLVQYSIAVLSVALALGTTLLLGSYLEPTPTPLFFVAVMVSAWHGGIKPGIVATILSTLAINYFLLEPDYTLGTPNPGTVVRLGVFVMAALLINSLNEAQRSARRRAEANFQSLRESEARFGCLAESNIIGMLVAELDGAILDANQNFLQLLGYSQEELRAGRLNWREITSPGSSETSERAVQELLTTGACTPFEKQYIRKDGSQVPVLHGAVMTGKATVTGFVLDLSEHQRLKAIQQEAMRRERSLHAEVQGAKAQLETVLASINDQFLVLDHEWRYIYLSDRVVEVVGKSREELLGKCIWDLFPETVNTQFYWELQRALAEQQLVQFEYFYAPWQRWFENRVYPSTAGVSILVTDITDRKRAEEGLQRSNQTLQTLLDACPVAITFFDPQGIVQLWNRSAERIFGWRAEEAIGQFMPTVPHRSQAFLHSIQTVLSGQSLDGFEAQHQRKDGQMIDLEIWANLTYDAEGNPGCLGIAWDITERKQAEAVLRASEERYRLLVTTTTAVVWTTNAEGGFVSTQPSWEAYTGQSWQEYAGWGWLEMFHLDDREALKACWEGAVASRSYYEAEGRLWHADSQQYRYIVARAVPLLNADGSVREWIGMDTDIHDRKQAEEALRQSEEQYRAIYNQVLVGISQADLTGKIIETNERFCEIVGRSSEELLSLHMQDITHPDDLPRDLVLFQQMLENGTSFEIEKRYIRPDGSQVWVRNYVSLISDANGQPKCGVAVTEDITEQKQAEIEREQLLTREKAAREEAETANRIKDEFLAVLSHELRSPLNPILGWSRLLQTQKFNAQETQQALATIERNAKLQTQLIEDLLDVSRILRGKLVLNITAVSLISMIEAALETVRVAIDAKGIHIQKIFNLDPDQVVGDAARLQQVVWNLLSNAVKFTPAGGQVEIRLEQVGQSVGEASSLPSASISSPSPSSTYAQIQVRDTGKGISPQFLPYVFDYFRQEDGTITRKFGGLGLGLAIVRHITELHGGTVSVESPGEGLGATFTVQLPLLKDASNGMKDEDGFDSSLIPHPSPSSLAGIRVLAVDDDADIRMLLEFILQQTGAEVRVVTSATEALQQLEAFSPKVLISDIGMPDFDGYMLMREIKNLQPAQTEILAIALTAYAGEIDQQQAIAAGFQMHLAKPVEPGKLIDTIVTLLSQNHNITN